MTDPPEARLNYVELSVKNTVRSRAFFEQAFGGGFTDYGPTHSATTSGYTDIDLDSDPKALPLPIIESSDLDASLEAVRTPDGKLLRDIYTFPGGRRFEFADPDGNAIGTA